MLLLRICYLPFIFFNRPSILIPSTFHPTFGPFVFVFLYSVLRHYLGVILPPSFSYDSPIIILSLFITFFLSLPSHRLLSYHLLTTSFFITPFVSLPFYNFLSGCVGGRSSMKPGAFADLSRTVPAPWRTYDVNAEKQNLPKSWILQKPFKTF